MQSGDGRKRGVLLGAGQNRNILAIDPGTTQSAYAGMREDYSLIAAADVDNDVVLNLISLGGYDVLVIECMEARTFFNSKNDGKKRPPQKIGNETYETCYWIGRFMEAALRAGMDVQRVTRGEEKSRIIPTKKNKLPPLPEPVPKGTDPQIRAGLIQRFAKFDKRNGRGKAKEKDVFYGFAGDMWSAFAVGVVYLDREKDTKAT